MPLAEQLAGQLAARLHDPLEDAVELTGCAAARDIRHGMICPARVCSALPTGVEQGDQVVTDTGTPGSTAGSPLTVRTASKISASLLDQRR